MDPGNARVLTLRMAIKLDLPVVLKLEEFEYTAVLVAGVGLEVVEHGDETPLAVDDVEEGLEVLAEKSRLPIIEKARFKASSRYFAPGAALRSEVPGLVELTLVFVAIVEQALVQ